jgi:hypothetical protein
MIADGKFILCEERYATMFGTAAGIIGALINRNATEQGDDMTKTSIVFGTKE